MGESEYFEAMIRNLLLGLGSLFFCLPFIACAGELEPLQLGAKIPSVKAVDQDSVTFDLAAEGAKGYLLVYFYPKAFTPGCTAQACSLRDSYEVLTTKGIKVIGVSSDKSASQKAFKEKNKLPFRLVADPDHNVEHAFGVPLLLGFATRQAYLFKDGVLVWKEEHASTAQQAKDVLDFLASPKEPKPPTSS